MWSCASDRDLFLGVLKTERSLEPFDLPRLTPVESIDAIHIGHAELMLLWREDPRLSPHLPDLIIVPDGEVQDFLAWTSTYLGDYRPLTAQLRVLEASVATTYSPSGHLQPQARVEAIFAALIIAETLTYFEVDRDPSVVPGVAFFSSFSFSRARHAVLWSVPAGDSSLLENWESARRLGGQNASFGAGGVLQTIWEVVDQLILPIKRRGRDKSKGSITEACLDISDVGSISTPVWRQLIDQSEFTGADRFAIGLLREDRVQSLMVAAEEHKRRPSPTGEFICAYLANAIAPGSLDHYHVVRKLFPDSRSIFLWYGLIAGITPHSGVRDAFRGIGRRILRDVFRPASLLDSPSADCGLNELPLLAHREGSAMVIQSGGYASIEIAPCITTYIRWNAEAIQQPREQMLPLPPRISQSAEHALRELAELTRRIGFLNNKILREFDLTPAEKSSSKRSDRY
jgi:hypothetical protein